MISYELAELKTAELLGLCDIEDRGIVADVWEARAKGEIGAREQLLLGEVHERLLSIKSQLVNEATLWARVIYPLLVLAERDNIRAFAEVPLSATFARGELRGEVDGALARMGIEGEPAAPYLLVVEAKRGIEGHDPTAQLLGGLLCAARMNHRLRPREEHVLSGVYTVAQVWTFVEVRVRDLDGDKPKMVAVFSGEYAEKTEAATILLLLKSVVADLVAR